MAAAAVLMTAAAHRLRSTASNMVLREVSGSHKLTIKGGFQYKNLYGNSKDYIRPGWSGYSQTFDVAGRSWRIKYKPENYSSTISLRLELDPHASKHAKAAAGAGAVQFKFSLLDQSGNPVPKFTRATTGSCSFDSPSSSHGFDNFITLSDLEESGCLKDDGGFDVMCDITVFRPPAFITLIDLLWKHKRGADVTIHVGGVATFDAHGWLLAARSPVLEAALLAAAKENNTAGGGANQTIKIQDMHPEVFKAALHYMYSDSLPELDEKDVMVMAQGLLAAADRFELGRLKVVCEEMLSRRIDVGTAARTLAVAEQHGCGALKAACLEFMARPGNLAAVMDTEGFDKAKPVIAEAVMTEVFMK